MLEKKMRSIGYALAGLAVAWREEHNFRLEIAAAIFAVTLGIFMQISVIEWLFIFVSIGAVLSAEACNTALEELCDMHKTSHDPHIGKIKDLGAAAVFIASITSIMIGAIIFIPRLIALL